FFQAEDGIRYPLVTGVQTCALPIWIEAQRFTEAYRKYAADFQEWSVLAYIGNPATRHAARQQVAQGGRLPPVKALDEIEEELSRSEERRVGKGGRAGG